MGRRRETFPSTHSQTTGANFSLDRHFFAHSVSLPYLQHIPSRPIDSFCIEEWVMHDKKLSSQGKSISSFLLLSCRAQCAVCHLFYVSKSKITRNPFACEEKLTFWLKSGKCNTRFNVNRMLHCADDLVGKMHPTNFHCGLHTLSFHSLCAIQQVWGDLFSFSMPFLENENCKMYTKAEARGEEALEEYCVICAVKRRGLL